MKRISILAFVLIPTIGFAAKPPKPVDELEARVEALEGQVTALQARPSPIQVLANGQRNQRWVRMESAVSDSAPSERAEHLVQRSDEHGGRGTGPATAGRR